MRFPFNFKKENYDMNTKPQSAPEEVKETVETLTAEAHDLLDAIAGLDKEMTKLGAKRSALRKEHRAIHSKLVTLTMQAEREKSS